MCYMKTQAADASKPQMLSASVQDGSERKVLSDHTGNLPEGPGWAQFYGAYGTEKIKLLPVWPYLSDVRTCGKQTHQTTKASKLWT